MLASPRTRPRTMASPTPCWKVTSLLRTSRMMDQEPPITKAAWNAMRLSSFRNTYMPSLFLG